MLYLFFISLAISSSFYLYVTRNYGFWKKKGVAYEKPMIFFGSMKDVIFTKVSLGLFCANLYNKYKHLPFIGYYKMTEPAVMINHLELVKKIMIKDFFHFSNNDFVIDEDSNPILALNPFVLRDESWKKVRGAWSAALSPKRIRSLYEKIEGCSLAMVNYFKHNTNENPNEPHEARMIWTKYFSDIITNSVFRFESNSFVDPENSSFRMISNVFEYSNSHVMKLILAYIMPWSGNFFKFNLLSKISEREIIKLAKEIIADRKQHGFQKNNPLDHVMTYNGRKDITELEVAGFCFNLLFDGVETAAVAGAFTLYSLASNLDVQNKLHKEIYDAVKLNQGKLSPEIVHGLPYLDMVLSESLRMYPALLSSQRICTKDYVIPPMGPYEKEVKIMKGMNVVIPIYGLHMDPDLFPEPQKFDPERFSPENRNGIEKYSYIPFGEGPRMCVGAQYALNQLKIGITNLILNFEIRLAPEMIGKSIIMDANAFLYKNVGGLWITLHQREECGL